MNIKPDETLWHKCGLPLFPRRGIDGKWIFGTFGQVWCRKINGKWQYKQDEETYEHWMDRQI